MKLRFFFLVILCAFTAFSANAQKFVGGDISLLPTYEQHGVRYRGFQGNNAQVRPLQYWKDSAQWNALRVRLFVDPSKADSEDKGEGVWQDLDYVTSLAKRIKEAGYSFMLDLHYSDTWTDPGQHSTPAAWTSADTDVLADSVYDYTKAVLKHLIANDATPDFVQVGNEVTYGMMWPTGRCYPSGANYGSGTFANFVKYLQAGVKACREVCPNAKIVIHTEMSRTTNVTSFYNTLGSQVDYDIIGLSYYPDYHGTLTMLSNTLTTLERQHSDKQIMIVETGYGAQWALSGNYTATVQKSWPNTEAGQKKFADDLVDELKKHDNVTGLFWWMPEDNEYGASSQARSTWWNASLYVQNTGKPLAAMFELKNFLDSSSTGINNIRIANADDESNWYNLQGQRTGKPVRRGIYIKGGKKTIIR